METIKEYTLAIPRGLVRPIRIELTSPDGSLPVGLNFDTHDSSTLVLSMMVDTEAPGSVDVLVVARAGDDLEQYGASLTFVDSAIRVVYKDQERAEAAWKRGHPSAEDVANEREIVYLFIVHQADEPDPDAPQRKITHPGLLGGW